jgi:hypothetical protein
MELSEDIGLFIGRLFTTIKSEMLEWEKENQDDLIKLDHKKKVADQVIKERIEKMRITHQNDCERIQLKEKRKTQAYVHFLDSIDNLKLEIIQYYPNMPEPIALIIHHHATEMLDKAWHNDSITQKSIYQSKYLQLYTTIMEDISTLKMSTKNKPELPVSTLKLIEQIEVSE